MSAFFVGLANGLVGSIVGYIDTYEVALAKAGPPFEDWPDPMFKHIPTLIAGKSELTEYALHLFKTAGSEKAMPFLLRAFKINPESTDLRVALSIALQDVGQLQQSRQILEELAQQPDGHTEPGSPPEKRPQRKTL